MGCGAQPYRSSFSLGVLRQNSFMSCFVLFFPLTEPCDSTQRLLPPTPYTHTHTHSAKHADSWTAGLKWAFRGYFGIKESDTKWWKSQMNRWRHFWIPLYCFLWISPYSSIHSACFHTLMWLLKGCVLCAVAEMWNLSYRAVQCCVFVLSFQFHCPQISPVTQEETSEDVPRFYCVKRVTSWLFSI